MEQPPPIFIPSPDPRADPTLARDLTIAYLMPTLARRLDVPFDLVRVAMASLPQTYAPLLDCVEGVSAISAAAAYHLGVEEAVPYVPVIH